MCYSPSFDCFVNGKLEDGVIIFKLQYIVPFRQKIGHPFFLNKVVRHSIAICSENAFLRNDLVMERFNRLVADDRIFFSISIAAISLVSRKFCINSSQRLTMRTLSGSIVCFSEQAAKNMEKKANRKTRGINGFLVFKVECGSKCTNDHESAAGI
jgi:hypothetical protein